jgi:hypothetical protein
MQCPEIFAIYLLLLTSLSKHVSRKTQTHIYESFPPEFLLPPTLQLIFNLLQPGFHCIFQIFLCFRILNLELNNKCIIALISWLQHHIVSSESTLPVRSHNITILQFYNQPQNKWYRRQIYYYFQFFYPASRFRTF